MEMPQVTTLSGAAGLSTLLGDPGGAVVALDFDGTLAPIVDDPQQARAEPAAVEALSRLAPHLGAVAIVTGRPAATAVAYGGFDGVPGLEDLVVLGQYGLERWDAVTGRVRAPEVPGGVLAARRALPGVLDGLGMRETVWIEDKGRAFGVHTRRAPDPQGALEALREPLAELAAEHGLVVEPGRYVLELRPSGMDKGQALTAFVGERDARSVLFAGDDLGDLAAFDAVERLRGEGVAGVTVCSASQEVGELADRADLVVPGPPGVAGLLTALADNLGA